MSDRREVLLCACMAITAHKIHSCHCAKSLRCINTSKLKIPGKLIDYQDAVRSIQLNDNDDICANFGKQLFDAGSSVLGFVKQKHEDWFQKDLGLATRLLEEKKVAHNKLLFCPAPGNERDKSKKDLKECKARVQQDLRTEK